MPSILRTCPNTVNKLYIKSFQFNRFNPRVHKGWRDIKFRDLSTITCFTLSSSLPLSTFLPWWTSSHLVFTLHLISFPTLAFLDSDQDISYP